MQINKQRRKNSVKECYLKENNHEDKTVKVQKSVTRKENLNSRIIIAA